MRNVAKGESPTQSTNTTTPTQTVSAPPPPPAASSQTQTPTPQPATQTKTPTPRAPKPHVTPASTPQASPKPPAAKPPVAAPARPAPKPSVAPPATATLDLPTLEQQLKSTKAIGILSKIALKNQVDDLMSKFREHYKGKTPPTMMDLRSAYDLLIMKVLSMVQDRDQKLAASIISSRAAIWDLLADPKKFATLDV